MVTKKLEERISEFDFETIMTQTAKEYLNCYNSIIETFEEIQQAKDNNMLIEYYKQGNEYIYKIKPYPKIGFK